ncbi:ankyrin repeats (3 copies) domain-containing protein [Sarocladium implicatum]|nr:ankyrin repeats (3 copies) domain-containing protein [Sarocladium implicatum]
MALQEGLATVQLNVGTPRLSIVCVHGIGLVPETTWFDEKSGASWIEQQDYNHAFGWPAQVLSFRFNSDVASNMSASSIAVHATELLYCLEQAMANPYTCGLVFIAHGLGGIIVKKALRMCHISRKWPRIRDAATSICFLGTPHAYTDSDAIFRAVSKNVQLYRHEHHVIDEDDIREYADTVCSINAAFCRPTEDPLRLISFWETEPSVWKITERGEERSDLLFPKDCREASMPGNVDFAMNCKHSDMAHFSSVYDSRFVDFSKQLLSLVRRTLDYTPSSLRTLDYKPVEKARHNNSDVPTPKETEKASKRRDKKRKSVPPAIRPPPKDPITYWQERKEHEQTAARFENFMKSLKGWSLQNTGQDIFVAAGTCEWMPADPAFRAWFHSRAQDSFAFISPPGSGKTHIAKAVAAHIAKSRTDDVVLSFFCGEHKSTPRIWEYFTWSLLHAKPLWFSAIPRRYQVRDTNSEDLRRGDFVDIWSALRESKANDNDTIWLIVDGLDHCGNEAFFYFWESLQQIRKRPTKLRSPVRFIKFLFTGGVTAATAALAANGTGADVTNDIITADISHYVDARLASIVDSAVTGEVKPNIDALASDIKAASMYYWPYARDAMKEVALSLAENSTKVKPFIGRLPDSLETLAHQTLLSLRQSIGPLRYVWPALVVILANTLGSFLNVHQLKDALGALYGHEDVQSLDLADMLLHRCGGLLGCFGSGGFDFVHPSFASFLNRDVPEGGREADAAYLCMTYLLQDRFADLPLPETLEEPWAWINTEFPFYSHAASYCLEYLARADVSDERLPPLFVKLVLRNPHQWSASRKWSRVNPGELDVRTWDMSTLACAPALRDERLLPLMETVCHSASLTSTGYLLGQAWSTLKAWLGVRPRGRPSYILPKGWLKERNGFNRTPLLETAFWCQYESLEYVLSCGPDVQESGGLQDRAVLSTLFGSPRLEHASSEALRKITEKLLRRGANPNQGDQHGVTPLHVACARLDSSIVQLLFDFGANANIADRQGLRSLETACMQGTGETIAVLIANGAEVDTWFRSGETALSYLARKGKVDLLRLVLPSSDVNAPNRYGDVPIHVSMYCPERRHEVLELLLSQKALNVDQVLDENGAYEEDALVTPLLMAIQANDYQSVEMLLNAGAFMGVLRGLSILPLTLAVVCQFADIVDLLLRHNAPVNEFIVGPRKRTALSCAARVGNLEIIHLLLDHGADPTIEDGLQQKNAALSIVRSKDPNPEALRLLLECPNPPRIFETQSEGQDSYSNIFLRSCRVENVRLMDLLLEKGVDLSAWLGSSTWASPLHTAVSCENAQHCQILLDKEPGLLNVLCKRETGEDEIDLHSPLHEACYNGHADMVKLLLKRGADLHQLTHPFKRSCLLLACMSSDSNTVLAVLDALGDDKSMLDLASYTGELPLEEACLYGSLTLTEELLKAGASVTVYNGLGETCMTSVLDSWLDDDLIIPLLRLLIKYGSDINNHLSWYGASAFGVAVDCAPSTVVRWLSNQGGDPFRPCLISKELDLWENGLRAISNRSQSYGAIDILLEAHKEHLDAVDWAGHNALGRFREALPSPYLARLNWKCEDIRRQTSRDIFAEMMLVPDMFGMTPLDRALGVTGCRPEARSQAASMTIRLLDAYMSIPEDSLLVTIMTSLRRGLQYEKHEDIRPLMTMLFSKRGLMLSEGGEECVEASTVAFFCCNVCDRHPFNVSYYCHRCEDRFCEACVQKGLLEQCEFGEHLIHDVPLDASLNVESEAIQQALRRIRQVLVSMESPQEMDAIREGCETESASENNEDRLQTSLQLATLHAFNMLAVRRPMWTKYLPLSGGAIDALAPFERNIAGMREVCERKMLDEEATVERRKEELRYTQRAFGRIAYVDEELFMTEQVVMQVEGLFEEEVNEGGVKSPDDDDNDHHDTDRAQ